jgi:hypothetical protein
MIKWTVAAFVLAVASPVHAGPVAPMQQPASIVTQVLEGCGPGLRLLNGICVPNPDAREERREQRRELREDERNERQCALGMRWVDGRCIQ